MRISLLASAALVASIASPAMAADMFALKAPAQSDAFNWTGCYVGANFGSLYAETTWITAAPTIPAGEPISTQGQAGIYFSGQGGCNYQFLPWAVVGVQGDYGRTYMTATAADNVLTTLTDQTKVDSLASVTGRFGLAWWRLLTYVKAGGAWSHDEFNTFNTTTNIIFPTTSEMRSGWTAGGGFEYAIISNLSMYIEYDLYNFGTRTESLFVSSGGPLANIAIRSTESVVKVGLNWTFR
jgi:outer membrane immunogenic protein